MKAQSFQFIALFIFAVGLFFLLIPKDISVCTQEAKMCPDVYCTPESRNAGACIELYMPVCGWFDPAKIQCFRYPCAQTYSNSCFACSDENVLYYTEGECPS